MSILVVITNPIRKRNKLLEQRNFDLEKRVTSLEQRGQPYQPEQQYNQQPEQPQQQPRPQFQQRPQRPRGTGAVSSSPAPNPQQPSSSVEL